jgi:F-box and WD-40 domain protein 1/11
MVADLRGGHTGKIFCVGADRTKVVSCGEDMRICVWDFTPPGGRDRDGGLEGVEW